MKPTRFLPQWFLLPLLFLAFVATAPGQTYRQTFANLRPGWNALWVEVEPTNNAIDVVFSGQPVEAVWSYVDKSSTADFIQNANELPFNNPAWVRYFPTNNPRSVIRTLFTINANRAYLVKLTNTTTLNITGRPSLRPVPWTPDALNLRGFPVDPGSPPSFTNFFAAAPAHTGQPVYRLATNGLWQPVAGNAVPSPGTNLMKSGEAYWVYSRGGSTYTAPLELQLETGDGLDYTRTLNELTLTVKNLGGSPQVATVSNVTAGTMPLSYYDPAGAAGANWINLPNPHYVSLLDAAPGTRRLAIRRPALPSDPYGGVLAVSDAAGTRYLVPVSAAGLLTGGGPPPNPYSGLWVGNAILDAVSDANEFKQTGIAAGGSPTNKASVTFSFPGPNNDVQIVAQNNGANANGLRVQFKSDGTASNGLAFARFEARVTPLGTNAPVTNYVLTIDLNQGVTTSQTIIAAINQMFTTNPAAAVKYTASAANSEAATGPVAEVTSTRSASGGGSQFPLRLIVHVDSAGTPRLLKQVIQLWRNGAYVVNPTNGLFQTDSNQPGRFVLLTDDARIMDFKGVSQRDGESVGRRISSAGIDFPDQNGEPAGTLRALSGQFAMGSTLTFSTVLPFDFRTNPFRHRRHPDHDNIDDTDPAQLRVKAEAPTITRTLSLGFSAAPPADLGALNYGENLVVGSYREELTGLHKRKLVVTGTFRLNRLSVIGQLNP